MRKAIIKNPFSMVQWFGDEYPDYEEDAEENTFNVGDKVLVLHEAKPNPMGRLYVVFNEKNQQSAVITEKYIGFIE